MLDDRAKREGETAKTRRPVRRHVRHNVMVGRSPALESAERKAQQQLNVARQDRRASGSLRRPSSALEKISYAAEETMVQPYQPPQHLPRLRNEK